MTVIHIAKTDRCCRDCNCCDKETTAFFTDYIHVRMDGNVLCVSANPYENGRYITFFASEIEHIINVYLKAAERNRKYMYKELSKTEHANYLSDRKNEKQKEYNEYFAVTHVRIYDKKNSVTVPISELDRIYV